MIVEDERPKRPVRKIVQQEAPTVEEVKVLQPAEPCPDNIPTDVNDKSDETEIQDDAETMMNSADETNVSHEDAEETREAEMALDTKKEE